MAGIRIRHPKESSVTYTIVAGDRPYKEPVACWRCGRTHEFKTYHFDLDATGAAIVSVEVWEKLQQIPGQPFTLEGEVKKPPKRFVGLASTPGDLAPILEHREK